MDVLDVVPHLQDRGTVLELLKSTTRPFKPHVSRSLDWTQGYSPTFADVEELMGEKRADLAELILESTADTNVLYAASQSKLTVALLKAVCRNRHTPLDLLVFLYCDSRKSLSQAAQAAIAGRMQVFVNRSDDLVELLVEAVNCPEGDLPKLLASARRDWPVNALDTLLTAVIERPEPVSRQVWSHVVSSDWRWMERFSRGRALAALAPHPFMTVENLESLLVLTRYRAPRRHVLTALLEKLPPSSERWLEVLLDLASDGSAGVGTYAPRMERGTALELLRSGRVGAPEAALLSGHLTTDEVRDWVYEWSVNPGESRIAALFLEHPALDTALIERCLAVTKTASYLRSALAKNPSLSEEQQVRLAMSDAHVVTDLARNPQLTLEGAAAIVHKVCQQVEDLAASRGGHSRVPWSARTPLTVLLGNASVPERHRLATPASLLCTRQHELALALGTLVPELDRRFASDASTWRTFLGLLPEWEGSIGDLVAAVESL